MKMKFLILISFIITSCNTDDISVLNTDILPTPLQMTIKNGQFSPNSIIMNTDTKTLLGSSIHWLQDWKIPTTYHQDNNNFHVSVDKSLADNEHTISISKDSISISGKDKDAIHNAISTIYQLQELNNGQLPQLEIKDHTPFSYRGMHLDVARHMFSVDEIKKYIDYLSMYKINRFHWHLTEDQGWRIEIKKYPKLQSIAAYREETMIGHYNDQPHKYDGKRYGGYYSQEEIKSIIDYAMHRDIEVIPEIDIPGHSLALLSAYPELGCGKESYKAATKWGVFSDVLCPKEETFKFLENVFSEIIELFPSKYIHIGGDECPKDQWKESKLCQSIMKKENLKDEMELQSYFIRRIEKYINSKGKQIIGWDEILEGGLAPNATVMSWRGIEGGIEAASNKHDVIMTPTSHCYFDYYQSQNEDEPLAIGGYTPYQKVYEWSPIPENLEAPYHKYVIGGQGNVWTEYIKTFKDVEYMALTRMITLSEVLWGRHSGTIDAFNEKLFSHTVHWKSQNTNIANHLLDISTKVELTPENKVKIIPTAANSKALTFWKGPNSESYDTTDVNDIYMSDAGKYSFYGELDGQQGNINTIDYNPHIGNNAKITLIHQPSETYNGNGAQSVINGIMGPDNKYGGSEWLGFQGDDFDATISFNSSQKVNIIDMKFFKGEGQWIYLPSKIEVYKIDSEGIETSLAFTDYINTENKIALVDLKFPSTEVDKLRIKISNYGIIPDGRQGGGHPSWLFVDEIIIR